MDALLGASAARSQSLNTFLPILVAPSRWGGNFHLRSFESFGMRAVTITKLGHNHEGLWPVGNLNHLLECFLLGEGDRDRK